MSEAWDREPLWEAVRIIIRRDGPSSAGEIAAALKADGWDTSTSRITSRTYQLLREKMTTGELVTEEVRGSRARTYNLAADMPSVTIRLTGEEYAALYRVGRKIHRNPEDTARRLMQAGIAYMREVLL